MISKENFLPQLDDLNRKPDKAWGRLISRKDFVRGIVSVLAVSVAFGWNQEEGQCCSPVPLPPLLPSSPESGEGTSGQKVIFYGKGLYGMYKPGSVENGRPSVDEGRYVQFVDGRSEQFAPVGETLIYKFDKTHTYWGKIEVCSVGEDISIWLEGSPSSRTHQGLNYYLETFN